MSSYRIELRIFGLLMFALISTLLLAYGLDAAGVEGEVVGIKFTVVGPGAAFITMILVFYLMRLFEFGLVNNEAYALIHPTESLTIEEIESMLDEMLVRRRKIERRSAQLEAAKAALLEQSSNDDVMIAVGMRPVGRPKS